MDVNKLADQETEILKDFRAEFDALCKKYRADVGVSMEGDTHGVYNEHVAVSFLTPEGYRTQSFELLDDD
jgi:hypothetical protein